MKMAKASEADLSMAMELANAMEALNSRWGARMPDAIDKGGPDDSERFSLDEPDDCRRVCEYLIRLTRSASIFRVVMGMAVLLDPVNKVVDPDADTLETHPDHDRRLAVAQRLADALSDMLDRAADSDVDYGPDHAVTIARAALAEWEQTR